MTHPMIPPATISAGLCTPRYRRLNITDIDPGEREKKTLVRTGPPVMIIKF